MEKSYFRVNRREYCHINSDYIFIVNTKEPTRIPTPHDLGEGWGVKAVFRYILFFFLFVYTAMSITFEGFTFFTRPLNYGALILLLIVFNQVRLGFIESRSPTILRSSIRSAAFKKPVFSFPRLVVWFDGPENKVIKRSIRVMYPKEAEPVLRNTGVI